MKRIKYLALLLTILFALPFAVDAKEKINVYLFRGEGCPHCQEAEEFFDSINGEYGKYYNLVDYETWYDESNASLMEKVAKELDDEIEGVPYIIIGKKTWNGYASNLDDEIKKAIKDEYNKDSKDRYDVIEKVGGSKPASEKSNVSGDILAILIIVLVVGGVITGIIFARKKSS